MDKTRTSEAKVVCFQAIGWVIRMVSLDFGCFVGGFPNFIYFGFDFETGV